ncbi:MAG: cupin domain-containing protein [Geobacteraceae bacterium]|nr:cupin domain-containing protein [Geobacteraceae bacterium]
MKTISTLTTAMVAFCLTLTISLAADYKNGVSATVLKKSLVTDNGRKIAYPVTDRAEVTAVTVDLAVGAETGWHSHPIPVYAYVVSGVLTVELENGRATTYQEGDAIFEVVNTLHNGRNLGKVPVRLAVFYTGIEGAPNVVKPASPHPAITPQAQ